jgi:integrase
VIAFADTGSPRWVAMESFLALAHLFFLLRDRALLPSGQSGLRPWMSNCAATTSRWTTWLNPVLRGGAALPPNQNGQAMSRSNVMQRLSLVVTRTTATQPSLATRRVSPHTLRRMSAMHLWPSGVPFNVIAVSLGHESTTSTLRFVKADLAMKE